MKPIDILRQLWYKENDKDTSDMDNREIAIHVGKKAGIISCINALSDRESLDNILAGADQQGDDDKGYQLSTHEKQQEFAKNRNQPPYLDDIVSNLP